MKKLVALLLALVLVAFPCIFVSASAAVPDYVYEGSLTVPARGDMDGDGNISTSDAIHLLYAVFTWNWETVGDAPLTQSGDVNGDGAVTIADAIYLLHYVFGNEDQLQS